MDCGKIKKEDGEWRKDWKWREKRWKSRGNKDLERCEADTLLSEVGRTGKE